jgi:hypothetical protein
VGSLDPRRERAHAVVTLEPDDPVGEHREGPVELRATVVEGPEPGLGPGHPVGEGGEGDVQLRALPIEAAQPLFRRHLPLVHS